MAKGLVYIYTGNGKGKSSAALGRALQAAIEGKSAVIIRFLKGNGSKEADFLRRMEPEQAQTAPLEQGAARSRPRSISTQLARKS